MYYNDVMNIFTDDYETLGDEEIVVEESNNSNLLVLLMDISGYW